MKKNIAFFCFLGILGTSNLFSQSVDGVSVNSFKGSYIQIIGTKKQNNPKFSVYIDYGQYNF